MPGLRPQTSDGNLFSHDTQGPSARGAGPEASRPADLTAEPVECGEKALDVGAHLRE